MYMMREPQNKWIVTAVLRRRLERFAFFKALNLKFWIFVKKMQTFITKDLDERLWIITDSNDAK